MPPEPTSAAGSRQDAARPWQRRPFKRRLVDCFATQRRTLTGFRNDVERFRPARAYDFTRPPHAGRLFYDYFDSGMNGMRWRALAGQALAAPGIDRPWA